MAITSEVKLAIYNGALRRIGSRALGSVTENREPRRVLDGIWDGGIVNYALERGDWNFATRTVHGIYAPGVEPDFGFSRAFEKPDDLIRVSAISADEYFTHPLIARQYADEAGYWFCDMQELFIRYISSADNYGLNGAAWSQSFKDYLECLMASRSCERLTNSTGLKDRADRDAAMALTSAKSHDAMAEGVKFFPRGSWSRARGR